MVCQRPVRRWSVTSSHRFNIQVVHLRLLECRNVSSPSDIHGYRGRYGFRDLDGKSHPAHPELLPGFGHSAPGPDFHLRILDWRLRLDPPERQLRSLLRLHPDPTHPGADRLEVGGGRLSLLDEGVRLRRVDSGRGRRWRKHRQQLAARPHA